MQNQNDLTIGRIEQLTNVRNAPEMHLHKTSVIKKTASVGEFWYVLVGQSNVIRKVEIIDVTTETIAIKEIRMSYYEASTTRYANSYVKLVELAQNGIPDDWD